MKFESQHGTQQCRATVWFGPLHGQESLRNLKSDPKSIQLKSLFKYEHWDIKQVAHFSTGFGYEWQEWFYHGTRAKSKDDRGSTFPIPFAHKKNPNKKPQQQQNSFFLYMTQNKNFYLNGGACGFQTARYGLFLTWIASESRLTKVMYQTGIQNLKF